MSFEDARKSLRLVIEVAQDDTFADLAAGELAFRYGDPGRETARGRLTIDIRYPEDASRIEGMAGNRGYPPWSGIGIGGVPGLASLRHGRSTYCDAFGQ